MTRKTPAVRIALLAAIAALVLALVPVASAGKGGGKGKPGGGSSSSATLYSSCNPCAAGTVVSFWGSGYDASQGKALLNIQGGTTSTAVYPDGTIAFDWPYFRVPGSYDVKAYQWGNGGKLVLKAQVTVLVQ